MKTTNKNKKLYIIILAFVLITIVVYAFPFRKIEAPVVKNVEEVKNVISTALEENKIGSPSLSPELKYKIVSRSVVVPEDIKNKTKAILLTIDDGPSSHTKEMIEILNKHNAKAIFFINGMHAKDYPSIIEDTYKEGFAVGNHTWDHLNLRKATDEKIIEQEINKNTDLITKLTGSKPRFFRAPYGDSNPHVRKLVKDAGMIFMDWSGTALDWEKSTIEKDVFVGNVMRNIHNGSIILIHEHPWSVANLDALLIDIESKGYTYVDPKDIIE
ncbi:TPA: xylanase deacetylase [Candidatus Nomurabacteria bacterium]|nr:MAG: Polysaccharide deacetylase [Candidatus Nomurabacteria bacterium GW2011_GWE2_36_115]KKP93397.1 MAG: Polysaccharide deacetylase [Candidatus Nomurabacteria bacterium GW2011_GWF2_36_126]KKP96517.1 MAG: Polysaccharide deacetylase [Candidatus Nomurabacteria bacterium GW2011_GWD2_36_14]KKP99879.1 MAG: Polysaccharide deacetylase [Candidatus Nomurabacteria bacterium GW2011_GWF2_36_19]KKQ04996.1 MAG: Polysaccharide deacetylase [Candidatus Nomurabacteria bacterium GW2011_GWF1_36_47]KKQ08531.1 MAG